ncbi:MAG: fused DSP-PTPase phosphatase/NAD kinase-like protein [Armatimonadota bacterium]
MRSIRKIELIFLLAFSIFITGGMVSSATNDYKPGLPNFHKVDTGIYRGGAPTDTGLKNLKEMNIQTIIDLRISPDLVKVEKKIAEKMGFKWLNIPMGKEAPTQKQVDTFLSVLEKSAKEPVFVHCQHGADRTGCMIGIYRVKVQQWSFQQAWTEMRKYGFKLFLNELKDAVRKRAVK